jgi:hypothetical protein
MFTKKDLFWLVKEQYPNVQIGKSLADYKEAVAKGNLLWGIDDKAVKR